MKGTEHFKDVIQNYLETRASYDELFAESFRKENKNIDECITYILTAVQKMGCAGRCIPLPFTTTTRITSRWASTSTAKSW